MSRITVFKMAVCSIIVLTCASSFLVSGAENPDSILLGDVDRDSVITIADATLVQKYAASLENLTQTQKQAARVTESRRIDVTCATAIQRYLVDLDTKTLVGSYETDYSLPDYWDSYLNEKTEQINSLQKSFGSDAFSFVVLTDVHEAQNLGGYSGRISRRLMDECGIPYTLMLGDAVTRGCMSKEADMELSFERAENILDPIRDRMLQIKGNHDGAWGRTGTKTYQYQYSNAKIYEKIYMHVEQIDGTRFSPGKEAYYIDDPSHKVRYIMLNSHHNDEQTAANGTALHNPFNEFRFGQVQFDWLTETALDVPEGYSVIVGSHVPIYVAYTTKWGGELGENVLMRRVLRAYNKRMCFSDSFAGTHGSDAVSVDVDFSHAKGNVIAVFSGHIHFDSALKTDSITVVTHRCDARTENRDGKPETTDDDLRYNERVKGTITEQSLDVVTVSPSQKTIYCTKIGAGEDRVIEY